MNITERLTHRAAASGSSPAVIDDTGWHRRQLSFSEFDRAATRLAAHLRARGLAPGDGVLVLQPVSLDLCLVLVALLRAGLVAVFVDPSAGLSHLDACCRLTRPRAFIGCARAHLLRLASGGLRQIPRKWRTAPLIQAALDSPESPVPAEADLPPTAPALVRFTSGSTGEPKPAVRTHGFLVEQLRAIEENLHLESGQIDLVTMPMFMLPNLAAGVTSVIPAVDVRAPGRIDPVPLLQQITDLGVTRLTASPALLQRLADHLARHRLTLDSLRRVDTGGAPVWPGLLDTLHRVAPQAEVVAVYGSTEAEPIALLRQHDITPEERHAMASGAGLLAGRPVPGVALRLIREGAPAVATRLSEPELESLAAPAGAPGEIIVSGPHVHPGQSPDPAREPNKIFTGTTVWHRTGDTGRLGPDGKLWLLGRTAARLVDERGTLHPLGIEAAMMNHPGVRRAALVPLDGRRVLIIETPDLARLPAIPAWIRAEIDDVFPVRKIPLDRRHNAKIDYPELHRLLARRRTA